MNHEHATNAKGFSDLSLEDKFYCVPCHEGLLVIKAAFEKADMPLKRLLELEHAWFLPKQKTSDKRLFAPRLPIDLNREQLSGLLQASSSGQISLNAIAATSYGPIEQDKKNNEDYALSGIITSRENVSWAFAAVSDGVSTKTFWANRTSRIASLAAYQAFYRFIVEEDCVFDGETDLEKFREYLVSHIIASLRKDQEVLNSDSRFTPLNWKTELYEKYKNRDEFWYNATLLCACLGPEFGIVLYAGDGGIDVVKFPDDAASPQEVIPFLRSTEETKIENFVSLNVTPQNFRIARINYETDIHYPCRQIEVYLSSDGVDRTLQLNEISYQDLDTGSPEDAYHQLDSLAQKEKKDLDNYSLAKITLFRSGVQSESEVKPNHVRQKPAKPVKSDLKSEAASVSNLKGETAAVSKNSLWKKPVFFIGAGAGLVLFLSALSFLAGRYYFPYFPIQETPPNPFFITEDSKSPADELQEKIDSTLKFSNDNSQIIISAFLVDKTFPQNEINKKLEEIAALIKQHKLIVTIYGYADGEESANNTKAGQKRADLIKNILETQGIPKDLLNAKSLGGVKHPIKDEKNSVLNRAVAFCVAGSKKSGCIDSE
jgi:outer membrane protein OmpA-like peptidoglycan-associated protein